VVTVLAATPVTATFTLLTYTVSVTKAGTGGGTVTSDVGGINCGTTCSANLNYGTHATLTAIADGNSTFMGWSGGGCSGTGTCMVTISGDTPVTATFNAVVTAPMPILHWTLDADGTNSGSASGYALTFNGSVSFVTGKVGNGAAQFNSGSYGVVQGSARAVLSTSAQYTIGFWINASSSPNTANSFFDFNNRTTAPYGGIQLAYFTVTQFSLCVATTTDPYLGGSCAVINAPAANAWHHVIMRYAGTGTGAGQGAGVDVYIDDVLVHTTANDSSNDPVFSQGISDTLSIGTGGITLDDVRVYNSVFTVANQCTQIVGGTWSGSTCTLP
jgi:hypothetical protein